MTSVHEPGVDFHGGLLHSPVPGRTDKLNINVPNGAYVIPADIVSGLGEGNTLAGAQKLQRIFGQPGGPSIGHLQQAQRGMIPIVAAGGEFVVNPNVVRRLGGNSLDQGHKVLDLFVTRIRKRIANQMLKLPGPKK